MKSNTAIDEIDRLIVHELVANARLSMRELAVLVHLSAPAVGERVRRLEEAGIISGYHARVDSDRIAPCVHAFVNVKMNSADHQRFLAFAKSDASVRDVHRVSGDSCYLLRTETPDHATLEALLERVLAHGNYRVNIVLSTISSA